ncbi:MAG TPA: NAD-dependent epimerase/dehydratase family protein [Dongiaceae bacterium]|nr:NAD-dependent epimerase/dehydratase family protein [Dongiaceae bacterium]
MKILLTGANGFVGSHVLDQLRARGLPTAILLRPTSNRRFIQEHLSWAEVRTGSLADPPSLDQALAGITHVVHCAGCTRATRTSEFYEVNHAGTRNLIQAANAQTQLRRLVHLSSLAASGPALPDKPALEQDPPHPVSEYGKSKLAGELEVLRHCRPEFVILRPPGVYGPRDVEFLRLFKAVKTHLLPRPGRQALSLVFVQDLAQAIVTCLDHPAAARKTYFAACPEIVTARSMAGEIAAQMGVWTVPLPLPVLMLWPLCLGQEILSRLTGRPNVLSLQKFAELRAPGWVCDSGLLRRETGCACPTTLEAGIGLTLAWYRQQRWI